MSSTSVVTITLDEVAASFQARIDRSGKYESVEALRQVLGGIASGALSGKVEVHSGAVAAGSAAIAVTYANVDAADTVTIGGVVLTAKASGAVAGTEFNKETNATVTAANLATAINANTTLSYQMTAVAATGTVTLTAINEGAAGNLIVLSTSDATAFGLTQFSAGSDGTRSSYSFGIA